MANAGDVFDERVPCAQWLGLPVLPNPETCVFVPDVAEEQPFEHVVGVDVTLEYGDKPGIKAFDIPLSFSCDHLRGVLTDAAGNVCSQRGVPECRMYPAAVEGTLRLCAEDRNQIGVYVYVTGYKHSFSTRTGTNAEEYTERVNVAPFGHGHFSQAGTHLADCTDPARWCGVTNSNFDVHVKGQIDPKGAAVNDLHALALHCFVGDAAPYDALENTKLNGRDFDENNPHHLCEKSATSKTQYRHYTHAGFLRRDPDGNWHPLHAREAAPPSVDARVVAVGGRQSSRRVQGSVRGDGRRTGGDGRRAGRDGPRASSRGSTCVLFSCADQPISLVLGCLSWKQLAQYCPAFTRVFNPNDESMLGHTVHAGTDMLYLKWSAETIPAIRSLAQLCENIRKLQYTKVPLALHVVPVDPHSTGSFRLIGKLHCSLYRNFADLTANLPNAPLLTADKRPSVYTLVPQHEIDNTCEPAPSEELGSEDNDDDDDAFEGVAVAGGVGRQLSTVDALYSDDDEHNVDDLDDSD